MISKKMYTPAFAKKKNIQGSTLVEVIVSVILLTLGLLALMATQLRSVSGLTEAENKSLVSQSTEALAESMLMNGTLVKTSSGNYYHSYASYLTQSPVPITGNITPFSPTTNTEYTKASIADEYKKQFESELYENLIKPESSTVSSVIYTICLDKEKPEQPTLDSSGKNMITNCQSGGAYTTIKVVWRSESTKDRFNDYSYVLRVAN
ncbi:MULTISPECIES: type IV pilus modification protein PilV [Kingella]|jgi:type IV pilus modification protein pilV|uniref:Type IV pilus modification protein PilV n=1 Tax=Kingella bonacorsii TaxID=2796361 RepID=A0ABS1BPR2_9NEIS|nr:type IV pilus modification protein PilV [Kingella bonacorsii]MBK0395264.1 type IV pilus modification protein PilV [Kingella bonacorsii]